MAKITFIIIPETEYMFYGLKLIKIQNKKYLGLAITWGGAGTEAGQIGGKNMKQMKLV